MVERNSRNFSNLLAIVDFSEYRLILLHLTKGQLAIFVFEMHLDCADIQLQPDLRGAGIAPQRERCSECGMTRERQFFLDRKNSHANAAFFLYSLISGKDKSGLREIHFPSDSLHLVVAEASSIGKHSQGIAFEGSRSENVKLSEGKAAIRFHAGLDSNQDRKPQTFAGDVGQRTTLYGLIISLSSCSRM